MKEIPLAITDAFKALIVDPIDVDLQIELAVANYESAGAWIRLDRGDVERLRDYLSALLDQDAKRPPSTEQGFSGPPQTIVPMIHDVDECSMQLTYPPRYKCRRCHRWLRKGECDLPCEPTPEDPPSS